MVFTALLGSDFERCIVLSLCPTVLVLASWHLTAAAPGADLTHNT
jgi:hypothetical protein